MVSFSKAGAVGFLIGSLLVGGSFIEVGQPHMYLSLLGTGIVAFFGAIISGLVFGRLENGY